MHRRCRSCGIPRSLSTPNHSGNRSICRPRIPSLHSWSTYLGRRHQISPAASKSRFKCHYCRINKTFNCYRSIDRSKRSSPLKLSQKGLKGDCTSHKEVHKDFSTPSMDRSAPLDRQNQRAQTKAERIVRTDGER